MYTTQTPTARDHIARIAAGSRVRLERERREAREVAAVQAWRAEHIRLLREFGASLSMDGYVDWCHVCSRPTDHVGEHTPEQVAAWRERAWVIRALDAE